MGFGKPQQDRPKKGDSRKQRELKGKRCNHDRKHIVTNRNGRRFEECEQCDAFLRWID